MRKGLVLGIVVFGLLAGCALRSEKAQRKVDLQNKFSRIVMEQGELLSSVASGNATMHTVKYRGRIYECWSFWGLSCSSI